MDQQTTVRYIILLLLVSLCQPGRTSEIYRCVDNKGKTVFSDNKRFCEKFTSKQNTNIEKIDIEPQNLHSKYGAQVSKEYYNYAFRAYQEVSGHSLNIIAENRLIEESPSTLARAIAKLERAVDKVETSIPASIYKQFNDVKYYFFTGEESRTGGRRGGQWYFRKGNSISPRFDDSIVIRSAKGYLSYSEPQAARTAVHELAHAYYYYHIRRLYKPAKQAYQNALKKKLYRDVKRKNGNIIKKAYALTNQREYFAELIKIYHLGGHHYPFNREELQQYDPMGYKMVRDAFYYSTPSP